MKKTVLTALAALAFSAGAATAQDAAAPPRTTTTPPAVTNPSETARTTAAPVAGQNSFTEDQARARLETNGYTQVRDLSKDAQSIWHAKAMKSGKAVGVTLDYQGNITMK